MRSTHTPSKAAPISAHRQNMRPGSATAKTEVAAVNTIARNSSRNSSTNGTLACFFFHSAVA